MVAHACHPSYVGSINRRITVQANLGINVRPQSKNKKRKNGWWSGSHDREPV
jgi:hypothetical protein